MTHDLASPDTTGSNPTIVLLDPTSPDGEAALDRLSPSDHHVTLVVLLSGPCSNALREFAIAEDLSLSEAGWSYLDQVAERLRPLHVEQIVATGPDAALELATISAERAAREILVPPSAARRDKALLPKLQRWTDVPVVVTEMITA
jgi:hypothetical protein